MSHKMVIKSNDKGLLPDIYPDVFALTNVMCLNIDLGQCVYNIWMFAFTTAGVKSPMNGMDNNDL